LDLDDLHYSTEHVWVSLDDDQQATLGLCECALDDPVEIRKLQLRREGDEILKDEVFGRFTTSEPGVFRLYSPLSGEITEFNEEALENPEVILEDPYEEGWLIRLALSNEAELDDLMTREEYEEFIERELLGHSEDEKEDDEDEEDEDEDDEEEGELYF